MSVILYFLQWGSFGTVFTRLQLWVAGFEAIRTHPTILVFGNGGKTMLSITPFFSSLEYPNTHNGIFNLLIFYGVPALLFYLMAFGGVLRKLSKSLSRAGQELKPVGLFAFSSLIALVGIYFFEPITVGVNMQAHFFLIMAVSIKFNEFTEEKRNVQVEN
jgi:O-antigen ligase